MSRRRHVKTPPRSALSASDLEAKMMEMLRGLKSCAKLKGVRFVFVGSHGKEPNWFAHPIPTRVSEACRSAFISALGRVRQEFDLLYTA